VGIKNWKSVIALTLALQMSLGSVINTFAQTAEKMLWILE